MSELIEGQWDELIQRTDLRGRRVRIMVLDEVARKDMASDEWMARLRNWANSHSPADHFVDDSRGSIYSGQ